MAFGNILAAENMPPNLTWKDFLIMAKKLEIGMSENDARKILGSNFYEKKEGAKILIEYSYSSFKGPIPDFKSTRSVKLVFAEEYKGKIMILSEISFACYTMISHKLERPLNLIPDPKLNE